MQKLVYCNGIKYGTLNDWYFCFNQYRAEQDPLFKENLFFGLSCSREPWVIQKYLNDQIDPSLMISNSAVINGIKYTSANAQSYLVAWDFVKINWDFIYTK